MEILLFMGYTLSSLTMFNLFQTYVYCFLHFYSTLTKLYNQFFFKGAHVLVTLFYQPYSMDTCESSERWD